MYSINNVQKFTYLKRYLVGVAQELDIVMALTEANYREAREALHKRFGNKQAIRDSHIESLLSLPTVQSHLDAKRIKGLYDKLKVGL